MEYHLALSAEEPPASLCHLAPVQEQVSHLRHFQGHPLSAGLDLRLRYLGQKVLYLHLLLVA